MSIVSLQAKGMFRHVTIVQFNLHAMCMSNTLRSSGIAPAVELACSFWTVLQRTSLEGMCTDILYAHDQPAIGHSNIIVSLCSYRDFMHPVWIG